MNHSEVARRFAKRISEEFSSGRFREVLQKAAPQNEQKDLAKPIGAYLEGFRNPEHAESLPKPWYAWEGDNRRRSAQERRYDIFGARAFPDAAILGPFRCALEFDREPVRGGAHFKRELMKAAVHVLSGAYDACVFVYILRPASDHTVYLDDRNANSTGLFKKLRDAGLHVSLVPRRSA
jgi:hypothetical protein